MNIIESAQTEGLPPIVFAPENDRTLESESNVCLVSKPFCIQSPYITWAKVLRFLEMPHYSLPWTLLVANGRCNLPREIAIKSVLHHITGCYQFTRMPVCLKSAHGRFPHPMYIILSSVKYESALVCLEDMLEVAELSDEKINYTRQVLMLLNTTRETLELKNCKFFTNFKDYSGLLTKPEPLDVLLLTIKTVCSLAVPPKVTKCRSIVGFCNIFRQILPNFSRIAAALNVKLGANQLHVYTKLSNKDLYPLRILQEKLTSPLVLAVQKW